jgi:hypothetical protein
LLLGFTCLLILPAIAGSAQADDLAGLKAHLRQELAVDCRSPDRVQLPDEMFVPAGEGRVDVYLGFAECDWNDAINPWCGMRLCTVRTYLGDGAGWQEVGERLE